MEPPSLQYWRRQELHRKLPKGRVGKQSPGWVNRLCHSLAGAMCLSSLPWQGLRPGATARLVSWAHSQALHTSPSHCRKGLLGEFFAGETVHTQASHTLRANLLASRVTRPAGDLMVCASWHLPLMVGILATDYLRRQREVEVVAGGKRR